METLPKIFPPDQLETIVTAWSRAIQEYDSETVKRFNAIQTVSQAQHAELMANLEQMFTYIQTVKISYDFFFRIVTALQRGDVLAARDLLGAYQQLCTTGAINPYITMPEKI